MFHNLYKIIKEEQNSVVIQLDTDNIIFKVHFEGNPILPGACMTEICRELIERKIEKKLNIKNIKNIKFLQLISPREHSEIIFDINISELDNNVLSAKINEFQAKINICDVSGNQVFAKISMILENVG